MQLKRRMLSLVCLCMLASMTLGCSGKEALKYEAKPLVIPAKLTDKVKPPIFEERTDLVDYSLTLLDLIDKMNEDRATVRKSIDVHNQGVTPVLVKK